MAITFFGANSNPADNGTSTATTVAVTPPASMVNGDLVLFYGYQRGSATRAMSATGGQTWNQAVQSLSASNPTMAMCMFWCVYNGTWSADPSIVFSAGTNTNAVMLVFRPTTSGNSWGVDVNSPPDGNATSQAAAATITISWGITPSNASTVSVSAWMSDDDNTWGTLSGSGWSKTGLTAQYRNTSGNDVSSTYAYNILSSAASIANVSQTQTANGNDPTLTTQFIFYEFTPVAPSFVPRMALMGVG